MAESKRFMELVEQIKDLHLRKNAGYAGQSPDPWYNFRMAELFDVSAFRGCLVRMTDKMSRISSLTKNPANDKVGESIKDTLMDLSIYALIAICLYEEEQAKKDQPKLAEGVTVTNNAVVIQGCGGVGHSG